MWQTWHYWAWLNLPPGCRAADSQAGSLACRNVAHRGGQQREFVHMHRSARSPRHQAHQIHQISALSRPFTIPHFTIHAFHHLGARATTGNHFAVFLALCRHLQVWSLGDLVDYDVWELGPDWLLTGARFSSASGVTGSSGSSCYSDMSRYAGSCQLLRTQT